jgi:glycosyltransferase involved in cell wall biosynthesis
VILGIDATTLKGQLSGVGYYTARLIESLANGAGQGVLERIVVLSNQSVPVPEAEKLHVHAADRFSLRSVWMQCLLPGILKKLKPDLVHFTNYLAPAFGETPYVLSIHDMTLELFPECHTWRKRLLTSRLLPVAARAARLILAPSEATRRDVVRLLGVDVARVRVIPYAASPGFRPVVPDAARLEREYGVRPPYFLYVGTLEPRKNLDRALRAFARIAPSLPEHQLVLVGQRGWRCATTLREAARPELRSRVVLPGYVPEADLPGLMSGATAFVYPSLYEGFGLPVVEAMACGTPVITSRSSSLAEIADGAAFLVDPCDERALAEAFSALATDAGLRERLAASGRLRTAEFSWERTGRETVAAYQEAAAPRPLRFPAPTRDAGEAIVRSVTYASIFGATISVEELARSLMDVRLDQEALRQGLEREAERGRLELRNGEVLLPGCRDWLARKAVRHAHTQELIHRHGFVLRALARFPYVRLLALSGACAHDNACDEDVDVFLIVRSGRAWGVFAWLLVLSKLLGLRRSLCLNYTIDEEALALPEQDLFTACEMVGLRPLAGRDTYLRFVAANPWLTERFPNFVAQLALSHPAVPPRAGAPWLERLLDLGPAPLLERLARPLLGAYLRWRSRGRPGVRLEPHRLKLHIQDHAPRLATAFEAALARTTGARP